MTDFEKYAVSQGIGSHMVSDYGRFNDMLLEPVILEERKTHCAPMSIFSRLLSDRIIFIGTPIDDDVANIIQAQLLYLSSLDDKTDISIYLNTPGGSVSAGLGIYDTMELVKPEITTICTGLAASMGSVLLSAGAKGKRKALKHSSIMLHEPMGGLQRGTKCADFLIEAEQIKKCKDTLFDILAENCGKTREEMEIACAHDKWLDANEALDFGIIDEILVK